jgi:hypothetical protein
MDLSWLNNLPEPARTILIGAAGDFLGGMAAEVTGRLIDAAGYQAKKRFRPEPQQLALNRAMAGALFETANSLTDDPVLLGHVLDLLGQWLAREAVVDELSQVIDPRPGVQIDAALLRDEFEALEYVPETLAEGVEFEDLVARLVAAFYDAAATESDLQGQIEIGLLREIAEQVSARRGERSGARGRRRSLATRTWSSQARWVAMSMFVTETTTSTARRLPIPLRRCASTGACSWPVVAICRCAVSTWARVSRARDRSS